MFESSLNIINIKHMLFYHKDISFQSFFLAKRKSVPVIISLVTLIISEDAEMISQTHSLSIIKWFMTSLT